MCVEGCACDPLVMDSHWADRTLQLELYQYKADTVFSHRTEVKCVEGCACDPVVMDSHWADHTSQLVPFKVAVSQAPA